MASHSPLLSKTLLYWRARSVLKGGVRLTDILSGQVAGVELFADLLEEHGGTIHFDGEQLDSEAVDHSRACRHTTAPAAFQDEVHARPRVDVHAMPIARQVELQVLTPRP